MSLYIPEIPDETDNLAAAMEYGNAGWYVGAAKRGTKHPGSVLGKGWHTQTSRDPQVIAAMFAGTDHSVFLHLGRSGALGIDVDHPDKFPEALRKHLLTAPYQSTRPGETRRGHYPFVAPPGRLLGNGTGKLGGSWGEIRGQNGVIIVAPSVHPSPDGEYRWHRTGIVPVLPAEIADLLPDGAPAEDAATDQAVAAFIDQHTSAERPGVLNGIKAAFRKNIETGQSCHTSAISAVAGAMKEAAAGLYPAKLAIDELRPMFANYAALGGSSGRTRTGAAAESEWQGILAWAVGQALAADPDETRERAAEKLPEGETTLDAIEVAAAAANTDEDIRTDPAGGKDRRPQYTDVAIYLAGGAPELPKPAVLQREDGVCVFYAAKRNELYGDPEDGKTMVLLAAAVHALTCGGCVLFVDLDNNGPAETVARLLMLGADPAVLADPSRFRHIEPADADEVLQVVADCAGWATFAGIDCVGELLPLFRASSDSADDYTRVMQIVSAPLERGGAAVILLDHQAKGQESRSYGAGGTMAKRRAVSGVSINLVRRQTFTPGKGGIAELWVNKDRPGGLRAHCPKGEGRRQFAGTFTLDPPDPETGVAEWRVTADRSETTSFAIDPVVERHYEAAAQLGARGGGATAREIATKANGLPSGTPPTESQKKAAQRAIDKLVQERRLTLIAGASPKRWSVTDPGEFVRDTDRDITLFENPLINRDKIGTSGTNRRSERGQIRDIGTLDTTADRDDTGSPPTGGPLSLRASSNENSPDLHRAS